MDLSKSTNMWGRRGTCEFGVGHAKPKAPWLPQQKKLPVKPWMNRFDLEIPVLVFGSVESDKPLELREGEPRQPNKAQ